MKNRQRGFTLIELLVVMTLMLVLMTLAVPVIWSTMRQGKIRGAATETAVLMRRARLEAIKDSCLAIVRIVDAVGNEPARVEAFADCTQPPDYEPDADRPLLGTIHLPNGVRFMAPPDLEGKDSLSNTLSENPADSSAARMAIFESNGSVRDIGGIRFGDDLGNFLEVWVEPAATARIEIHKCRLCTNAEERKDWQAQGDGGQSWEWK
ncbi:MAG: Tfp pilus assembly protein FimT/FimU [Thermoanaerobaculia bacterium]